jgi:hypothetical protein
MEIMSKRTFALALCLAASPLFAAGRARAQEGVSPEKAALIKELIELTNARANARTVMESVVASVRKDRERVFELTVNELGADLPASDREELIRKDREDSGRVNERVMALFREKIDFDKVVVDVSYVVYDRHYTVEELRDLAAFYKTPTGQKSIKVMPVFFSDSMEETGKRLTPQLEALVRQMAEEERRRVEGLLPPKPKPKPKRPAGGRRQ